MNIWSPEETKCRVFTGYALTQKIHVQLSRAYNLSIMLYHILIILKKLTTLVHKSTTKEWLFPHLNDLHGHTQPLCFKFKLKEDGKAGLYYRQWSTDPWSEEGLILLKVSITLILVLGNDPN